jgi:hypothetical protein
VPLPKGVDPSKNVTKPVGVPVAAVTVAVNVTVSPSVMVVDEAFIAVVVAVELCPGDGCAFGERAALGRAATEAVPSNTPRVKLSTATTRILRTTGLAVFTAGCPFFGVALCPDLFA